METDIFLARGPSHLLARLDSSRILILAPHRLAFPPHPSPPVPRTRPCNIDLRRYVTTALGRARAFARSLARPTPLHAQAFCVSVGYAFVCAYVCVCIPHIYATQAHWSSRIRSMNGARWRYVGFDDDIDFLAFNRCHCCNTHGMLPSISLILSFSRGI